MHVLTQRVLSPELITEIYPSYVRAWDHVQPHVAARHILLFEEFEYEMRDERIEKFLVLSDEDEHVLGMTTLANDIGAVPWANDQLYRDRFAAEIERGAFFYIGYTLVHNPDRRTRAVYLMRQAVDQRVAAVGGVIGFDMSSFVTTRGLGRHLERLFPSSERISELDTQTYFVADYRIDAEPATPAAPHARSFDVVPMSQRPELFPAVPDLLATTWPSFVLAGHAAHGVNLSAVIADRPDLQVALVDPGGALRGVGLAVPVDWDGYRENLPTGWDDAVRRSTGLAAGGGNTVCGLGVALAPELQQPHLEIQVIDGLVDTARRIGAHAMIMPVRPTRKASYPLIDIATYADWRSGESVFDPAVRALVECGAEVAKVTTASMQINGTVQEWEGWTGMVLPGSGDFVIPGGLVPLAVDAEAGTATYVEPGVWTVHGLD